MTLGFASDDVVPLVELGQQHVVEVDRPHAIVDLFQANPVPFERVGDEQEAVLEAERPGARHLFDKEVPGIFLRGQHPWIRARGGMIMGGCGVAAEGACGRG